jgi:hypothetical protein
MNRIKVVVGGLALAAMVGAMLPLSTAYARHKVDCSKVLDDINGGKSVKETAADLHISKSSVRRCVKKSKAEAASPAPADSGASMAAPAPAPAPAPAAPAPAAPAPAGSPAH